MHTGHCAHAQKHKSYSLLDFHGLINYKQKKEPPNRHLYLKDNSIVGPRKRKPGAY